MTAPRLTLTLPILALLAACGAPRGAPLSPPTQDAANQPPRMVLLYRDTLTVTRTDGSLCTGASGKTAATAGWSGQMGGCLQPPGYRVAPGAAPRGKPRLQLQRRTDTAAPVSLTLPDQTTLFYGP